MPTIFVHYPQLQVSQMKLATGLDGWHPMDYSVRFDPGAPESPAYVFQVDHSAPFFYKPVLQLPSGELKWSIGQDYCMPGSHSIYPYFDETASSSANPFDYFQYENFEREVWLYQPPGASENLLKKYPLLILHDGQNVFREDGWDMQPTLDLLMRHQVIDKLMVLAVANGPGRIAEYGNDFRAYRDFLVEIMRRLDSTRLLPGPSNVGVMGSSMGGLASLLLAWDSPKLFGKCACLSPSLLDEAGFAREGEKGLKAADQLRDSIATNDLTDDLAIYLDSGIDEILNPWMWLTYRMLKEKGLRSAHLTCLSFPQGTHDEHSWRQRCHIPLQFLFQ